MPARALTLAEVARELGRTDDWLARHLPELIREEGMPKPLHRSGARVWSAAQIYAWLDRNLPPKQRIAAAAYRAALEAATSPVASSLMAPDESTAWRGKLEERFGIASGQ